MLGPWTSSLAVALLTALLSPPAPQDAKRLLSAFEGAADPGARAGVVENLLALGEEGARALLPRLDARLQDAEREYAAFLVPRIRPAFLARLQALDEMQIAKMARVRRLWKDYLTLGGDRHDFKEAMLQPLRELGALLLPKAAEIGGPEGAERRARMEELDGYRSRCRRHLGIQADPSAGRTSPTGIAYLPLDQPPALRDTLDHLERTLVLCHSVAPEGARPVLLANDAAAREIDVQEASFTLYCNEVRMLAGSVAWRVEPLGCAVERDHSTDRKEGRASGHMSTVPGKTGFTDRNRRMGAPFYNSEGAGGGADGPAYAVGLSYGGGHTGPLYSLKRNCVGVGRRAGVFTSQYRTDETILHPCQATEDELWMPPGIDGRQIKNASLQRIYRSLKAGSFGAALKQLELLPSSGDGLDEVLAACFRSAAEAELVAAARGLLAIEKAGDLYEAKRRLAEGLKRFRGVPLFEQVAADVSPRLDAPDAAKEIKIGELFHRLVTGDLEGPERLQAAAELARRHEESVYAKALREVLEDKEKKAGWFDAFLRRNPEAKAYAYPPRSKPPWN